MTRKWSLEKFLRKIASKVLKKVKFWNQSERGRGDSVVTPMDVRSPPRWCSQLTMDKMVSINLQESRKKLIYTSVTEMVSTYCIWVERVSVKSIRVYWFYKHMLYIV